MSGEFDARKDSQSTKFDRRPQIFIKLKFRELCAIQSYQVGMLLKIVNNSLHLNSLKIER